MAAAKVLRADLLLDARAATGERPVWDERRDRLLWVDVPAGEVHSLDPVRAADETVLRTGRPVGFAAMRERGGLVLGAEDGFALYDEDAQEAALALAVDRPNASVRMNDGLCDPLGRLWAGTLDAHGQGGALYRLEERDGVYRVTRAIRRVRQSNGLDWSVDGSVLYWTDTATRRVDAIDYDVETGRLANRRPFVTFARGEGVPDGLIADVEGGVWVAVYGASQVRRYDPHGTLRLVVQVPVRRPTCPTFGGTGLEDLFITSQRVSPERSDYPDDPRAGGIFACRPGVVGRAARRFAG